ncbi:uncharacterized protein EI90DRAFT_2278974 [Cantharellus anzutake]|uniref:uncharacterized protein n=1 Tax=Cantharellus anzutake TaxID=1750568 RepID=UPI0019069EC7|nr:uncharacterized protein EI90DRAFT_2278974 [Cantharellus anzutake]KAF8339734.1 hypothetical protein EI90DRAFT_2278974 [Cantharellus anzutake]
MDVDPDHQDTQYNSHMPSPPRPSLLQQQPQASGSHPSAVPSAQSSSSNKSSLFAAFGKKKKTLGIFGGSNDKSASLPPVEEVELSSGNPVSPKRTQSSSTGSRSIDDQRHPNGSGFVPHLTVSNANGHTMAAAEPSPEDVKKAKREERQRASERQKAMSRRVMQNRDVLHDNRTADFEWRSSMTQAIIGSGSGAAPPAGSRRPSVSNTRRAPHPHPPNVLDPRKDLRLVPPVIREGVEDPSDCQVAPDGIRSAKARRRDTDDDHSQSSVSISVRSRRPSAGTMDSDPGPSRSPPPAPRLRERPSEYNIHRAASKTSLRSALSTGNSSLRGYSSSARSSTSLEPGVITGFADMSGLGVRRVASPSEIPPNMHPQHYPHPHSHSPLGQTNLHDSSSDFNSALPPLRVQAGNSQYITLPPLSSISTNGSAPPHPLSDTGSHETLHLEQEIGMDPGRPPGSPMHPMFQERPSLPPFSHIASMADQGAEMLDNP